jgi:hypothetical protein
MALEPADHDSPKDAVDLLENPGFAIQITNYIGKPLEYGVSRLPDTASQRIGDATRSALQSSLRVAVSTMKSERGLKPWNTAHEILTTLRGKQPAGFGGTTDPTPSRSDGNGSFCFGRRRWVWRWGNRLQLLVLLESSQVQ